MNKQPDIIIFNPDQMRGDALAHLGNPAAITPNLDEFARTDAVSFRNAFCQNTVCVPSRCSFTTGLYPHVHGHRSMQYLLRPGEPTIFSELKDAGYYVWMNARNDLLAAQIPGLVESHGDEIYYGSGHPPGPGPEQRDSFTSPESRHYYSFYRGKLKTDSQGGNYNEDDAAVDAAVERVLNHKKDQPLCMFLGLMYPHTPYAVEDPYFSAIKREKLLPRAKVRPGAKKAYMLHKLRENFNLGQYSEADWNELRACYLGMCMKVDQQFKRLCDALKKAGRYENAAIFFFSDHGDYTGDYDLPEKSQNTFEHCLTNVPLLIKPPNTVAVDCGVTDSPAELVDFYATALDFAGVSSSHDHFGKSLRPILTSRKQKVKNHVFCEGGRMAYERQCNEYDAFGKTAANKEREYWPRQDAQLDDRAHAKGTMVFDGRYKYVLRTTGEDEFYDLDQDPKEEWNKIDDPAYENTVQSLQMTLLRWYQDTCDIVPRAYDSRFTPEMIWHKVQGICPLEYHQQLEEKIRQGLPFGAVMALARKYAEQSK